MSGRVQFVCDGVQVEVDTAPGETLLSVLRERLGITTVKDGCAPQGQCGCCTVLVDGDARVACVTPAARIAGRSVTTVDGLPPQAATMLRRSPLDQEARISPWARTPPAPARCAVSNIP